MVQSLADGGAVVALEFGNQRSESITSDNVLNYYVSLRNRHGHFCGGAIISDHHIITAANCIVDASNNKFVQDGIKIARRNPVFKSRVEIIGHIEKMYIPSQYIPGEHDIAVLKLRNSLKLQEHPQLKK
ncbi:granzyme K-like, partial [Copidosoma floridanum]|uniref:granzyme K-like n=1 Tax=Copidosoma floridanum TaxID=29053 RepID=UPI0006C97075